MKKLTIKEGEYTLEEIQKMFKEKEILKYPNGAVVEDLKGKEYFYIYCGSVVFNEYFNNDVVYKYKLLTRNVFLTQEEAERELKRKIRYYEIINEIDRINREENWVADWSDDDQAKWHLYYLYYNMYNRFIRDEVYSYRQNGIYMCKKAIDWVMTLHDEDKKILIGIYE